MELLVCIGVSLDFKGGSSELYNSRAVLKLRYILVYKLVYIQLK